MDALRIQLEGALEIIASARARYETVIDCLRSPRWVHRLASRPGVLRDFSSNEAALESAIDRLKRRGAVLHEVARIETLRDSLHAALERRLAHPAQLTQLQKVVDETRSLSAASPFPEWSTLAWAERDDVVERKNPYGHSELFVATTLTAAFSGVAAIIAAGIWAGGQEALQLLASAFGLLLSGWVAWSLSESLRERIATHWQSLRLGLSMTSGQRLVALGDVVVFQNNGTSSRVRPKETSIGRSRGTKSGLWRFHLQTGEKIFSRLNSEDADALELLLTKLGFTVELGH